MPYKLTGKGAIFDATNGVELYDQLGVTVTSGIEAITGPRGDSYDDWEYLTKQTFGLELSWQGLDASVLTALTGGSSATGGVKAADREQHTVSSGSIVLDNTMYDRVAVRVVTSGGVFFDGVTGTPAQYEYQCTVGSATITFSTADNGTVVDVTYYYEDSSAGKTVTVAPTAIPATFVLLAHTSARDTDQGADLTGGFVWEFQKVRRTSGEVQIASANGEVSTFTAPFKIDNISSGDVKCYSPGSAQQA